METVTVNSVTLGVVCIAMTLDAFNFYCIFMIINGLIFIKVLTFPFLLGVLVIAFDIAAP